ncbi:small-conductance mechanosensitive channel [Bosea sp. BK604]|nr:small-conductance mechanosensitive channel [Bosea sp. BK604]
MAAQACRKPLFSADALRRGVLVALALLVTLFVTGHVWAQTADTQPPRTRLENARGELAQIEGTLANIEASDADLQRQRARLQPLLDQLRRLVDEQGPRADQAKLRLEQLGPKPDAKAPAESADVATERETREKAFAEADETLKIARAALLQTSQIQTEISDRRRELFAKALFAPGSSVLNPELWHSALTALPDDIRASGLILGDWLSVVGGTLLDERGLLLGLAFLGAIGLYAARARYLPRFTARLDANPDSSSLHCLRVAIAHLVAGAAPPALASWLIYRALATAGLLPPRIQPVIWALVIGLALFAFVQALVDAVFAPGNPHRRLTSVMDSTARIVVWMAGSLAIVLAAGKVLEAWLQAIAAGLPISILVRGAVSIVFAVVLIVALYQLRDDEEVEEEANLGPYVPVDGTSLGPIRILGWVVGVTIAAATLAGYGVFASFLSEQVIWLGILACLFLLAFQLADLGTAEALTGKGRLALTLKAGLGFRNTTLQRIAVVVTGLLKLVLIVVTLMLALAPWGLESSDVLTSLRAAFFGFQVGGVTISLSSIVVAGLVFAFSLAATRAFQSWLDGKFLPTTHLDSGLRNSITIAIGYLGYAAAVALAVSSLGLSLERLTLVASALSVGIGFGLQSVVSNFVSGLILLWERPIRVGDQVVVGDAEGIVKRINVRSTEIATFDRSTVVVPNSNLISGVVRNRVRTDRTGRVLISITVPRTLDPTVVRAMLNDAATSHGDVMQKPPPTILFKKIGTGTMDFDLICVVADVEIVGRVTSDLNYVIHKRLAELEEAPSPPELVVKGLEGVEQSLGDIAAAVGREARSTRRAKAAPAARKSAAKPAQDEEAEEAAPEPAPAPAPEPAKDDSKE